MESDKRDPAASGPIGTSWRLEREIVLLARHTALVNKNRVVGQDLDRSAYLLLGRLELSEPMTLKDLADAFGLDVSTVNRQTAALLRQGLAERIADPDGGTARKLRPTAEGLRVLQSDRQRNVDGIDALVAEWDERDRRDLVALLRKLNEEIEQRQGVSWPRD
ncbi:MarR family transcriptional regulator [Rhodococcus spelaei]|uniref:MarR family transcriptional regulator n=1 Tax=Rhodococcus spelaei TaxID=2546320 RepID=A0A541B955_9NOCA|nr:MarR family transcriptional regulator [Rhodococcus spelaei]TQF68788.1 MarR family transcriptional regulator [Rhodococcus spelaei]